MRRNSIKRWISLACILAVSTAALAGCSSNSEGDAQTAAETEQDSESTGTDGAETENAGMTFGLNPFEETQELRIAYLAGAVNPYIIADKLGVFDALNIDVEFICFSGGPAEMEANSEWDIATCGAGGLCIATTAYDMHIIDIMNYEEHHSLWARPGTPLAEDPSNPDNWKCEWVYASGTTCQAVLAVGLQEMGLSMDDITSVNVDLATAYTAFDSGTGDAISTNPFQSTYAEEAGYVLVGTDISLGFTTPSGTVTSQDMLDNHMDLVAVTVAVSHLVNDWIYSSEENRDMAAEWFYENCQEEGYSCTEEVAAKLVEWYHGPTTAEWFAVFNDTVPDDEGLYTSRELLQAENDILDPLDFFISEGMYTPEDRVYVLDNSLVDNDVANTAKTLLDEEGVAY